MYIHRQLTDRIVDKLKTSDKGVVIYGARQVGKTTMTAEIIKKTGYKTLTINGDQSRFLNIISSRDLNAITQLVSGYEMLLIDEAQRIPEIGINIKIILDNIKELKVLITGSSSIDLASKISEPLTGRIWSYHLYPISSQELLYNQNRAEFDTTVGDRLVYGSYPNMLSLTGLDLKREYLQNLSDQYLYRDLLEFGKIKNSSKVRDLLKLLAFQIGAEVSLSELGTTLGMSKETISQYIDLLEKSFIIFRLSGLSRNLRKEVTKMDKIYFYDLGIRNILIDNLKKLDDRNDIGQLWENWLIVERIKHLEYSTGSVSKYFWRTYTGAELDYVEDTNGELNGFEFKWKKLKSIREPQGWTKAYPQATFKVISRENYFEFVS